MIDLLQQYRNKLITAEKAAALVEDGMELDWGYGISKPIAIDKALSKRVDQLHNVCIKSVVCPSHFYVFEADRTGKHFRYLTGHCSAAERKFIEEGFASYIPSSMGQNADWLYKGYRNIDIAMIQVAPMDKHGFFNFGPQATFVKACCDCAKKVIVEVNSFMPVALGGREECIHISEVDYIVEDSEASQPLPEQKQVEPSEVDRKIAEYIIEEIESGSCIQLGIGGIPNAIGKIIAQSDLKDLGVHTEMLNESMLNLYEAGKISGKNKTLDPGKMVYSFALGTKRLYDFIDKNPALAIYPCSYTNNPSIIAQNDKAISINNALEVDLTGQVCSESIGTKLISGSGGQLEFAMGVYYSKGGKSFLCLSSTYTTKDGEQVSRIKPILTPGGIVTTPRPQVHYLVTEYGKVVLKAKSIWDRAEMIIGLAAPQFRDQLIIEAEKLGIWRRSNKIAE